MKAAVVSLKRINVSTSNDYIIITMYVLYLYYFCVIEQYDFDFVYQQCRI